ncbi:MAG: TetR/AcrR family transcriptional regulator [Actinomycetes bacterium]
MSADTLADPRAAHARKGRPRDERIDGDIARAAIEVLADDGFDRFSVEEVALRAGVAKTTIYRRFECRSALIAAALAQLAENDPVAPAQGSVRERLVDILTAIRTNYPDSPRGRILMHAMASDDPELHGLVHERVLAPRARVLKCVIEEGIADGQLRPDLDVDAVVPILVGPMLYLGMWRTRDSARKVAVDDVVDLIMTGLTRAND